MTAFLLLPETQNVVLCVTAIAAFWLGLEIVDVRLELVRERENGAKRQHWFDKYLALCNEVAAYEEDERRRDDRVWEHVKRRIYCQPSPVALRLKASTDQSAALQLIAKVRHV